MNRIAIITAFLGGVKNRYMQYQPDRSLKEKLELASRIPGVEGVEVCYPQDFKDLKELQTILSDTGLDVSAVNVRSRREGKWFRGAFSSEDPKERGEVVEEFKAACDAARELGVKRITTCPLNDGHDYPFELDYRNAYAYAADTFDQICRNAPDIQICIEYKWNDPRTRCLLGSAGETALFCSTVGAKNLGVTLDFGHSVLSGERPAQAAVLLHQAGRLFYVHLNDNDRNWDWDMLPADTDPKILERFGKAFVKAMDDPSTLPFIQQQKARKIALWGKEAKELALNMESIASWVSKDLGLAKKDPQALGIPKPKE